MVKLDLFSEMAEVKVHNIRFYDYKPQSVNCMAYNENTALVALSRGDHTIEIWNFVYTPFMQMVIRREGTAGSVEELLWCGERLFCAGMEGRIAEYDITTGAVVSEVSVCGGAVWCMALTPDNQMLAVGTEQGLISLFDVTPEGVTFKKMLERVKEAIYCLAWHYKGKYLVSGGLRLVRLWAPEQGRLHLKTVLYDIFFEKLNGFPVDAKKNCKTTVWCIAVLNDMTIVTGDTRGMTSFWEGERGTLVSSVMSHRGAVLCLRVSSDDKVWVAGADPTLVCVEKVIVGSRISWTNTIQRISHTHDIRAFVLLDSNTELSGGVDTDLCISYPKQIDAYHAVPYPGSISVAPTTRCCLLRYPERLELWRLGQAVEDENIAFHSCYDLLENRVKLLELQCKQGETVQWVSLSPSALWIAYIVEGGELRVFRFYPPKENENISIRKLRCFSGSIEPSQQVIWLNNETLASATRGNKIQLLCVSDMEVSSDHTLTLTPGCIVCSMTPSSDGKTLVVLDSTNHVTAFNVTTGDSQILPYDPTPIMTIGLNERDGKGVLVTMILSDRSLVEFDLRVGQYAPECQLPPEWFRSKLPLCAVTFDSRRPDLIICSTTEEIIFLKKREQYEESPAKIHKKSKKERVETDNNARLPLVKMVTMTSVSRSARLLHLSYFELGHFVGVEIDPLKILADLPPPLRREQFGAK